MESVNLQNSFGRSSERKRLSVKSIVRLEKRVKFTGIDPFKALLVKLIDIHLPSVLVFFNNVEGIVPVKLLWFK
jgi:hypothetical protein